MDTDEALLVIDGHKWRRNEWDELLANLAKNIVAPPISGKGKSVRLKTGELKLYRRKAEPDEVDPEEARERQERVREISEALGPPALLKNKFGEDVTVTRLG